MRDYNIGQSNIYLILFLSHPASLNTVHRLLTKGHLLDTVCASVPGVEARSSSYLWSGRIWLGPSYPFSAGMTEQARCWCLSPFAGTLEAA